MNVGHFGAWRSGRFQVVLSGVRGKAALCGGGFVPLFFSFFRVPFTLEFFKGHWPMWLEPKVGSCSGEMGAHFRLRTSLVGLVRIELQGPQESYSLRTIKFSIALDVWDCGFLLRCHAATLLCCHAAVLPRAATCCCHAITRCHVSSGSRLNPNQNMQ